MAQKTMAKSCALGRAFDQAGNVSDDKAAVHVDAHHTQVRRERRERIIGNARARRRNRAYQRGLAGVGHAQEADVGENLELELEPALLARLARRRLPWRTVGARLEMDVAQPALAAAGDQRPLVVRREV